MSLIWHYSFSFSGNDTNMTEYDGDYSLADFYNYFEIDYPERDVAINLYIYFSPFLLFIGTFGNILSVIILQKLSKKVVSTCLYLAVLAIVDLIVLYTRCGNEWLINMSHIDLSNRLMVYSESICKVYPFVFNFIFHLSRWLIVAMSVEAFISIKYPQNVVRMCTLERGRAVILLLTVLLVCVNLHYFWSFELVPLKNLSLPPGLFCTFAKHGHQHSEEFQEIIWPVLDLLVAEVIPYVTVIICCVIMVIQMVRGKHKGDEYHRQWQAKYTLDSLAIDQLKVTFLIVCICYVLLTLPHFGYVLFKYLVEKHQLLESSFQLQAQEELAQAVCSTIEWFFLSSKFFLYLATSKRFRSEFVHLFRCCCRRYMRAIHSPSSTHCLASRPLMNQYNCESGLRSNSGLNLENPPHSFERQLTPNDVTVQNVITTV